MRRKAILLLAALIAYNPVWAAFPAPGEAGAPNDPRYCGEPERYANGTIKRSRAALLAFVRVFPCPATLEPSTVCAGWAVDHIVPRASGGCDIPANMQWLPDQIKSCPGTVCKDRWERKYHSLPRQSIPTP